MSSAMSATNSSPNEQGVFVDTTDYSELRQRLPENTPAVAKDRFQRYEDRKNYSVLSVDFVKTICHGKLINVKQVKHEKALSFSPRLSRRKMKTLIVA